jgi:hypothetical protein
MGAVALTYVGTDENAAGEGIFFRSAKRSLMALFDRLCGALECLTLAVHLRAVPKAIAVKTIVEAI